MLQIGTYFHSLEYLGYYNSNYKLLFTIQNTRHNITDKVLWWNLYSELNNLKVLDLQYQHNT